MCSQIRDAVWVLVVGAVDVDQPAPSVGELLLAEHPPETPDSGLFDGKPLGSRGGLRVRGEHVEPWRNGVVLGEGFGEMQNRENTETGRSVHRRCRPDSPSVSAGCPTASS